MENLFMPDDIIIIKEVTAFLACRLAAEGKIPDFKPGGAWRFGLSKKEAWTDARIKGRGARKYGGYHHA